MQLSTRTDPGYASEAMKGMAKTMVEGYKQYDYDVIIFGGTPGGIAAAVRAAREGQRVLLLNVTKHVGGMLTSGLGVMDTLFDGSRAPILDEFLQGVMAYYENQYGKASQQYADCFGQRRVRFEPHVGKQVFEKLLAAESNITLLFKKITGMMPGDYR